jgi:hypothetical protein
MITASRPFISVAGRQKSANRTYTYLSIDLSPRRNPFPYEISYQPRLILCHCYTYKKSRNSISFRVVANSIAYCLLFSFYLCADPFVSPIMTGVYFPNIVLSGVLALRLNCSNVYLPHFFAIQFVQPKLFAFLIHVSKLRDILFYFLPLASLLSQSIPECNIHVSERGEGAKWLTYMLTMYKPFGSPSCICCLMRISPASRNTTFQA